MLTHTSRRSPPSKQAGLAPLTILRGQIDGLADGLYQPSPDLVGSMSEEVERLRRLTSELSHLSRAEENAYQLQPRETDLAALTHAVASRLRPEFGQHGIALPWRRPARHPEWSIRTA